MFLQVSYISFTVASQEDGLGLAQVLRQAAVLRQCLAPEEGRPSFIPTVEEQSHLNSKRPVSRRLNRYSGGAAFPPTKDTVNGRNPAPLGM